MMPTRANVVVNDAAIGGDVDGVRPAGRGYAARCLAWFAGGIVLSDLLTRDMSTLCVMYGEPDVRRAGVLVDISVWLCSYLDVDVLKRVGKTLGIVSVPAFVVFCVALRPDCLRSMAWRRGFLVMGCALLVAYVAVVAWIVSGRLASGWEIVAPGGVASLALYSIMAATIGGCGGRGSRGDGGRAGGADAWGAVWRFAVGFYCLSTLSLACGAALFFVSGSILFWPMAAYASDGFTALFSLAFLTGIAWACRWLSQKWWWQSYGMILGCAVVLHEVLEGGGVYKGLLR